ncbi:hypothetical protein ACLESO_31705 [Pyxidicoccus sp. 3LG]
MTDHFITCFVPGPGQEAPDLLAEALSRAGRTVLERREVPPGGLLPREPHVLRWRVQRNTQRDDTALVVHEVNTARWDLSLFRELSAVADGIVVAREQHERLLRTGLATFLSGRSIEVATWDPVQGTTVLGGRSMEEVLEGGTAEGVFQERFADLCGTLPFRLYQAEVVSSGEWVVSPPRAPDVPEALPLECRMFLARVEEPAWRAAVDSGAAPGWRWRSLRMPRFGEVCIELRREGALDEAQAVALSASLGCPVSAFELSSGGAPFNWVEACQGLLEERGCGRGAKALLQVLHRAADFLGEGGGLLLGRGNDGWNSTAK